MIRKLQMKFVAIIMSIMTVTLVCIFGTVNLVMYKSTERQTLDLMGKVARSDGRMMEFGKPAGIEGEQVELNPPPVVQTNFSVKLDGDGEIIEIISDRNQNYSEEEIVKYVSEVSGLSRQRGNIDQLKFLVEEKSYGKLMVFFDNSIQKNSSIRLLWITIGVGVASMIVIFVISICLSKWAIRPVKEAYEVQKRFVADASHELKTPLTVILANADVITSEIGDNKWLSYIKTEAERMSELVNKLLYLAKSDAYRQDYEMKEFDLSDAVVCAVLPYESTCYEQRKTLGLHVKEHVLCMGDESGLIQVVIILLDNAIKNTDENGEINISLTKSNNKIAISVFNTGGGITEEEKQKIFHRFYRGDSSRNRQTGSYGLGLPIAKTIVEVHKGKIQVESEHGRWIKFTVVLPG